MRTTFFTGQILGKGCLFALLLIILASIAGHTTENMGLACYYYDKKDNSQNSSLFHAGLPWLWAIDEKDDRIYVRGKFIDGFFDVEELATLQKSFFTSNVSELHENSAKKAKFFCEIALRKAFPDEYQQKSILNLAVKSSFLSVKKFTPVFKNEPMQHAISKLVIFGDSLSDQANLKTWLRIVPSNPYFGGRFSNGRNWVDYFYETSGIAIQNFATGGSLSHENMKVVKHKCSLAEEVKHVAHSTFSGNVDEEIAHFRDDTLKDGRVEDPMATLFTILIGGNDYLNLLNSERDINTFIDTPDDPETGSHAINEQVTRNIENHLYSLSEIGARRILIINLPDFGIIPKLLETANYHRGYNESPAARLTQLSKRLSEITRNHNHLLRERVEEFRKHFPDILVSYADIYSGLQSMLLGQHIFKPATHFNYELDGEFLKSFAFGKDKVLINKACFSGKVCANPNKTLFWDYVHPSSYGHCLLAAGIHRQLSDAGLVTKSSMRNYLQRCRPELLL